MLLTHVFNIYSISLKLTPVPGTGTSPLFQKREGKDHLRWSGVSFNERTKKDYLNYLHQGLTFQYLSWQTINTF